MLGYLFYKGSSSLIANINVLPLITLELGLSVYEVYTLIYY